MASLGREHWRCLGEFLGNPMGMTKKISSRGVSDVNDLNRLTGFSIVKADTMDAALDMAKRCPHLEHGTVDVAEAMDMGM